MLDTRFPRQPGDLGRPDSWRRPVLTQVVAQAWPDRVVGSVDAVLDPALRAAFVRGARALEARGASAITTSCGFLVLMQQALQEAVQVPVATSALLLLPQLLETEPQVGVFTVDAQSLGPDHLRAAGVPPGRLGDVWVQGAPKGGAFAAPLLGNLTTFDAPSAGREVVDAALALRQRAPSLRTLVLECTNMPPYRLAIESATGWRVLCLADTPVLQP